MDNTTLILLALAFVTVPVLVGVLLRQIHFSSFQALFVPWFLTTICFAIAVVKISHTKGTTHLILSMALAIAWIMSGFILRFFQPKEIKMLPQEIRSVFSTIGWIFIGFGMIWGGITASQHLR